MHGHERSRHIHVIIIHILYNEDIREEREREFRDRLSKDRNVPSEYLNQMLSLIGSDVIPQANKLPITSFVHNDRRLCSKLEHNR